MSGKTLLLVEDEAIIAMTESMAIRKLGFDVIVANSGERAVAIATEGNAISLVLMDIDLGKGIDGTEAARLILEKRQLPIVFLTSHTEREMVERVQGLTRYGYVIKNSGNFVLKSSIDMAFELYYANAKKQESQERIISMFNSMSEGVAFHELVFDESGEAVDYRFIDINPEFEAMTERSRESLIGQVSREVFGFSEAYLLDRFKEVALEGKNLHIENYYPKDDKTYEISATPWGSRGFATFFLDITQKKKAEHILLENEKRFERIFQNSSVGYFVIDKKGSLINANQSWLRMYGFKSIDEARGKPFDGLASVDDKELAQRILKGIVDDDPSFLNGEFTHLGANNQVGYFSYSAWPVYKDDNFSGVEGFLIDMTAQKRATAEVRALLAEKEALLKELNHRVKNNLFAIESILRMHAETLKSDEAISVLRDSIGHLESMRILYEKLHQADSSEQLSADEYLERLVGEIVEIFPKGPSIKMELRLAPVIIEPGILFHLGIFTNELLTNAMKYAFEGREGGKIAIELTVKENRVRLVIWDDGIGIPASEGKKRGFGLDFISVLIKQIGGELKIESDSGTKCTIELGLSS